MFKAEQDAYIAEGIQWSKIEFNDNQLCLDLIQLKSTGIFAMLDEGIRLLMIII
jgi:myosin-5